MENGSSKDYLEIINFGPIADVKIQLEGLSVIIGLNNSGKSTFTNL